MITHIHYFQQKTERNKESNSTCEIRLGSDENCILYYADFYTQYTRQKNEFDYVRFIHELKIDKLTGDIFVKYNIKNQRIKSPVLKSGDWIKKNNFNMLCDLSERAFYLGEKRSGYWGVKYQRHRTELFNQLKEMLMSLVDDEFLKNKDYQKNSKDLLSISFFDLIVDFHLSKKKIKFHDNVYLHILDDYPKKKYLKSNDNKFLPAVLDYYQIKSKYFIGELSSKENSKVNIRCLAWLCKLFGDNHIEYIKRFDWKQMCSLFLKPKKQFYCKNESEKEILSKVLIQWFKDEMIENPFESVYKLFALRGYLEDRGYNLKIKIRTPEDIDYMISQWELMKKHLSVGYKLRYDIPEQIVSSIEEEIIIDGKVFLPKVLLSEDDFILEGSRMKNCMSKQFMHGALYIYVALTHNKKRINMQFRKGNMVQAYGKANSPVKKEIFEQAMEIVSVRISKFPFLLWKKEKYEIISN